MKDRVLDQPQLKWIDVSDPKSDDFELVAAENRLHRESVKDCMESDHLPKHEKTGEHTFLILRAYDPEAKRKSDSVQELTRKIAIFYAEKFVLTVHRRPHGYLDEIFSQYSDKNNLDKDSYLHVIYDIVAGVTRSFEPGVKEAFAEFDTFEQQVFSQESRSLRLQNSYFLKRHVSIMKRMLRMNLDALEEAMLPKGLEHEILFQNIRDQIVKLAFQLDEIRDGLTALLNLQVSLVSQKTNEASRKANEVMRVLTIFSVFVMPVNFIASLYGMNFKYMPELDWEYGYLMVIGLMVSVEVGVFLWFKNKGWLTGIKNG